MGKGPESKPTMWDLGAGAHSPDLRQHPRESQGNEGEEAMNPGLRV